MNSTFLQYIDALHPSYEKLMDATPFSLAAISSNVPKRGIYLLSEGDLHLYVGRSNRIRERLMQHGRISSGHRSAPFAFRLARESSGKVRASYQPEGSRNDLLRQPEFKKAFDEAIMRIRAMEVRIVEEADPLRQALLEIYVATSLGTQYNDFDNH